MEESEESENMVRVHIQLLVQKLSFFSQSKSQKQFISTFRNVTFELIKDFSGALWHCHVFYVIRLHCFPMEKCWIWTLYPEHVSKTIHDVFFKLSKCIVVKEAAWYLQICETFGFWNVESLRPKCVSNKWD